MLCGCPLVNAGLSVGRWCLFSRPQDGAHGPAPPPLRSHHLCPTVSQAEQDGAGAVSTAGVLLSPAHGSCDRTSHSLRPTASPECRHPTSHLGQVQGSLPVCSSGVHGMSLRGRVLHVKLIQTEVLKGKCSSALKERIFFEKI